MPPDTSAPSAGRALSPAGLRVVEQFADLLTHAGVGRMPARVFALLLVSDEGAMSAIELSQTLQVSPAAVSGAIRYLIDTEMVQRRRPIGSRRDVYRLRGDNWYEMLLHRESLLVAFIRMATAGAEALGDSTPAGQRMQDTAAFFEFLMEETTAMLQRWKDRPREYSATDTV